MKRTVPVHKIFGTSGAAFIPALLLVFLFLMAACEGPAGPQGTGGKEGVKTPDISETLSASLAAKTGGGTAPWTVTVSGFDLSDDYAVKNLFHGIAAGIAGEDLIVLDLSDCGGWGIGFNTGIPLPDKSRFKAITLPASVISISDNTFAGFTALEEITAPGLRSIGAYAFQNCAALTTIDFPAARIVGDYAFMDCTGITSINLPEALSIGDSAFRNCAGIADMNLSKVNSIGTSAFACASNAAANTSLTTVNIPNATKIDTEAFRHCKALATVTLGATVPKIRASSAGIFRDTTGSGYITIRVPNAASGDYTAAGWVDTVAAGNIAQWGSQHNAIVMKTY
jgi:hypothetical protein